MSVPDPITRFLDLRTAWGGGDVASNVQPMQWTGGVNYQDRTGYNILSPADLQAFVYGKDVLIATHGFNVNRQDGIQGFCDWKRLLFLPDTAAFLGLLWPGDSESLHALAYPAAPAHAMASGNKAGIFVDQTLANAASISFVSHSLGARVLLEAITAMNRRVRRAIIMAGAVDDRCLTQEFAALQQQVDEVSVLASKEDDVLRFAFPIGDLVAEIIDHNHPWWESALGRFGPSAIPQNYQPPCQIPKEWNYGHGDYLETGLQSAAFIPGPTQVPPPAPTHQKVPRPLNDTKGWQRAWSASFVATRFD